MGMPEITPEQVGQQRQRESDGEWDVNEPTRSQAVILEGCRAPIKVRGLTRVWLTPRP